MKPYAKFIQSQGLHNSIMLTLKVVKILFLYEIISYCFYLCGVNVYLAFYLS
jgi:hypothetical protein